MEKKILSKLKKEALLESEALHKLQGYYSGRLFSLHWEIKTVLYLGVLLLATGAGLIIYQNIDSISHQAILFSLALACSGCFYYCFRKGNDYKPELTESPGVFFDYLLLLGCMLFLSFEGYFQYKYNVFGDRYGLAALIPAVLFLYLAYRFDHKGVLSMGITGIAGFVGLSVTPLDVITGNAQFYEISFVWTGIGFGVLVAAAALLLESRNIKSHFTFTYLNFAANALFLACTAGLFMSTGFFILFYFLLMIFLCYSFFRYARKSQSFYFLLIASVYGYIAGTYMIFKGIIEINSGELAVYLGIFYFIGSCALIIRFFFNYKKYLKNDTVS